MPHRPRELRASERLCLDQLGDGSSDVAAPRGVRAERELRGYDARVLWRRRARWVMVVAALLALLVVPVALGAVAPQPGQRIDLKVLLVSATGTEATFASLEGPTRS